VTPVPRPWLAALSALFGHVAALRVAAYRRGLRRAARLAGPVISVGNLSVGGSGKTPVVAWLAARLHDAGLPVSILSRGYGGSFRGAALVVSDGASVFAKAGLGGDEPVMLAAELPGVVVAIGPRRDVVGRAVEARFGRRVHILDDGFQHLRLARDLDLVCLDAADLRGHPLPAGRLREQPAALGRADVLLLDEPAEADLARARALAPRALVLKGTRRTLGFFDLQGRPAAAPARPFLLSGIARPERFESSVRDSVGQVVGHRAFRDHHAFDARDLGECVAVARAAAADAIVTTAKDAVRLPEAPAALPILVLRIAAFVEDEGLLLERALTVARRAA
jgi:tetraacyldisaccharide 4'-kinase